MTTEPDHVRDALAELAGLVLLDQTLETVLERVAHIAKQVVPGADEVSMTLVEGEHPFTAAFTGQLALDADEMQYARGYGPCLDAGRGGVVILVPDMRSEPRYPDYALHAFERGVLSSLSLPLPVQGKSIGALNIYSRKPHAFDDESVDVGTRIAGYVAVAVANVRHVTKAAALADQMQEAMQSRAAIEQAKGILMTQRHCTPEEAFALLVKLSQDSNRKLRDVAAALVDTTQQR
jgi:GAF domain-containing protein